MTTKQKLADLLEKAEGEFFSGNLLAEKLGVTRAAVWKNIRQLEAEGYKIEESFSLETFWRKNLGLPALLSGRISDSSKRKGIK